MVPGGRCGAGRCRLSREGCAGVGMDDGCVKAVPYKGNKKVWKNQINAEFFVPEWKILHITILHVTFAQFHFAEKREKVVYRFLLYIIYYNI